MTLPLDIAIPDKNVRLRWSDLAVHLRASDATIEGMRTVPVYERVSPSVARDSRGRYFLNGRRQPTYRFFDLDGDGIYETPAICFFGERTTLLPFGADLGAWTPVLVPGLTEVAGLGSARVWRLTDDSANQEAIQSPQCASRFTVAGNGVIRSLIGKGTSGTPSITLRDVTNAADRGRLDVGWVGNVPSITTTGATVLSQELIGTTDEGIVMFEIAWKGSGTLTTADHAIIYRAAQTAGSTGDAYFGASHVEDAATYPMPLVLNPGAGARTFNRDEWRQPYDGHISPMSLLLDLIEYGTKLENGASVLTIGGLAGVGPELRLDVNAGVYRLRLDNGTTSVTCPLTGITMPTIGQRFKLFGTLNPEGGRSYSVTLSIQVGSGSWQQGTPSAALQLPVPGWNGYPGASFIQLGHYANNRQSSCIIEAKVAVALQTREQLAGGFG